MARRTQHYVWLDQDKFALCGKSVELREAITPYEWFPFHPSDCKTCQRVVKAHFFRQGQLAEFNRLIKESETND